MEGKMTTDILMLTLRENVGFASTAINNYLSALGVVTFFLLCKHTTHRENEETNGETIENTA